MIIGKMALYHGCWSRPGHHLRDTTGFVTHPPAGFPWIGKDMDNGLIVNATRGQDVPDGRVFWTWGAKHDLWFAFVWWDRSIDKRGNSNSGFYVRGFAPVVVTPASVNQAAPEAFAYARVMFPSICERQHFPLTLEGKFS